MACGRQVFFALLKKGGYKTVKRLKSQINSNLQSFQVGSDATKQSLVAALSETSLGVTKNMTWKEIIDTIAAQWGVKVGTKYTFNYCGFIQTFTAQASGIYKLETYGAQGGNSTYGGKGGYSVGYKKLTKGTVLYVCVGGMGSARSGVSYGEYAAGGYNGGGKARSWDGHNQSSGGGCTHIATMSGTLQSIGAGNLSKVLIVAGGGGGIGINNEGGGAGGGLTGSSGIKREDGVAGSGGTQSSGGVNNTTILTFASGGFGYGGYATGGSGGAAGGGGGLYGGGGGMWKAGAGGGSGYIGGLPQFAVGSTSYAPSMTAGQRTGNGIAYITYVAAN